MRLHEVLSNARLLGKIGSLALGFVSSLHHRQRQRQPFRSLGAFHGAAHADRRTLPGAFGILRFVLRGPREQFQRGVISDFARFLRIAGLLQIAQDNELAFIHAEERFQEVGAPLPAEAITAAAVVEAAKNSMEYRAGEDGKSRVLVRRHRQLILEVNPGAEGTPVVAEVMALLNLAPGLRRYDVLVGEVPDPLKYPREPSDKLRVVSRSTAQVYFYLANGVEVPLEHLNCGLVQPHVDAEGT